MEIDTNEFIEKLEECLELEKKIKGIKDPNISKESQDYRSFLNEQDELKKYVLNGEEIIEIYKYVKNSIERIYNLNEEESKTKINDLEEVLSNLKDSKNNLRNLIKDPKNFFNGKIVNEIKKEY